MQTIIRQIVNRDAHVGWSNRRVIRHVIGRLKHGYRTFAALPRTQRREFLRWTVACHAENRALYRHVTSGTR